MTTKQAEGRDERAEFEAWAAKKNPKNPTRVKDQRYLRGEWEGWQARAARASPPAAQDKCICRATDFRDGFYDLSCPVHGTPANVAGAKEQVRHSADDLSHADVATQPSLPIGAESALPHEVQEAVEFAEARGNAKETEVDEIFGVLAAYIRSNLPTPQASGAEPVAWRHQLRVGGELSLDVCDDSNQPRFGIPGMDHGGEETVTPLYASPQPAASGWRDIASAPRDGTTVLLYEPGWTQPWHRVIAARWIQANKRFESYGFQHERATHWMPLPAPPAAALDECTCLREDATVNIHHNRHCPVHGL